MSRLARHLNTFDAVLIGLGAMIGAGIFAAAGPAAQVAGTGLLIAVILAGLLAFLNASSMAQLAALYPESGGAYVYGKKRLGNFYGFLAGWSFVVGKLASCAAMALTFAHYAAPNYAKPLAASAVVILSAVNYLGIKKTALATKILVGLAILSLSIVIFASLTGGAADATRLHGWFERGGVLGILEATGMMFFAFAGYARIATLGEEVRHPSVTIPRAIVIALSITLFVYFLVVTTLLLTVDIDQLASSRAPLALAVESGSFSFLSPVVRIGACIAAAGVLLSLLAGVSRTVFAMAANKDLPAALAAVHSTYKVPHRAELSVGVLVITCIILADIRTAIGFSSFAILLYYAIANAAAFTLTTKQRLWPRWMTALGFVSCILIAFSLPIATIVVGLILILCGSAFYFVRRSL